MRRLSLALLGPIQITLGGQPVRGFTYNKARALLVYLAVEAGRPHHRDVLAALLWPELTDEAARHNLRQALTNLRTAIGDVNAIPPFLLITRDTIQLNPASDYELDVTTIAGLLAACETHAHRQLGRCRSCAARMEQAIAPYRGDFLTEFSVGDSASFEEWQLRQRERLHQRALDALVRLADYHERRGDDELGRRYAQRQIELEPWREEAHRQLMRLLARGGQRSAALAQYETCRRILARDLGVEPEAATTALYKEIRDKEKTQTYSLSPLLLVSPTPRHNFPAQTTPLIGREIELADFGTLLENPAHRLITLVGPGGIGKTRLALAAGNDQADTFADGATFVPLQAVSAAAFVAPAILGALGLTLQGQREPRDQLLDYLRDKELLLVLDNFEQVIDAARLVGDLLAAAPQLTVLITSRFVLRLSGEYEYVVPPLALPGEHHLRDLTALARVPAVELFVQRSQMVKAEFRLNEQNAAAVATICQRLDGLPLAIELAAARIKLFKPAILLARLDQRLTLLTDGPRDLPARQQTLRAALDWSYNLLEEADKMLFARLGVFVGGWTLEAAEAVCNAAADLELAVLHGLAALVDQSLLRLEDGPSGEPRFMMLETIREYALERLEASGEVEQLRWQHARYYEAFSPEQPRKEDETWARWLDRDQHNVRSALEWSLTTAGDSEVALRLALALSSHWRNQGSRHEAIATLQRALDHPLGVGRTLALANARVELAAFLAGTGNYRAAQAQYEQALPLVCELDDSEENLHPWILNRLGCLAREQGDSATAWARLSEGMALYRQREDEHGLDHTLNALAGVAILDEDPARAEALLAERHTVWPQVDSSNYSMWLAWRLNHLGHAAQLRGDYQRATELHQESLAFFRAFGDQNSGLPWAYHGLGETALGQGRLEEAGGWLHQAMAASRVQSDQASIAWCLAGLGSLAALSSDAERAARLWGAAERQQHSIGCRAAPAARATYERAMEVVRARFSEEAFAAAWEAGRAMTMEQAITYALEKMRSVSTESGTQFC